MHCKIEWKNQYLPEYEDFRDKIRSTMFPSKKDTFNNFVRSNFFISNRRSYILCRKTICKVVNCMPWNNELNQSNNLNFMKQIRFSPKRQEAESESECAVNISTRSCLWSSIKHKASLLKPVRVIITTSRMRNGPTWQIFWTLEKFGAPIARCHWLQQHLVRDTII